MTILTRMEIHISMFSLLMSVVNITHALLVPEVILLVDQLLSAFGTTLTELLILNHFTLTGISRYIGNLIFSTKMFSSSTEQSFKFAFGVRHATTMF